MNNPQSNLQPPRGYKNMGEILMRALPLLRYLGIYRPDVRTVTLNYHDFDYILRWPKAAAAYDIIIAEDSVTWRGFIFQRSHTTAARYKQKQVAIHEQS